MNNDLQRCPNCGAYVMTGDNICPRCDFVLDSSPAPDRSQEPTTLLPEVVDRDNGDAVSLIPDSLNGEGLNAEPFPTLYAVEREPGGEAVDEQSEGESFDEVQQEPESESLYTEESDPESESLDSTQNGSGVGIEDTMPSVVPSLEFGDFLPHPEEEEPAVRSGSPAESGPEADTDLRPNDPSEMPTQGIPIIDEIVAVPPGPSLPSASPRTPARPVFAPPVLAPPGEFAPPTAPRTPSLPAVTPPPTILPPPAPMYAAPPGYAYGAPAPAAILQQRIEEYRRGGYRWLDSQHPQEAILSHGKTLSVGGWMLALITVVGVLWYFLLIITSFFRADKVYLSVDAAGRLDEDGPGAAHHRLRRVRGGKRWAWFGLLIFVFCLVLTVLLGLAAGAVLSQERYQAALREAYPAVTLFEERFSQTEADPDDVSAAHDGAVAYTILAGVALVGLWGGATLFVIGTIHAGAYRVSVRPLPGLR
ncbi:MAG: hypothetical protein HY866_06635 [Chloroflexi bacterium]|nr:hypothetical protein [Chloroflexota bacterium]